MSKAKPNPNLTPTPAQADLPADLPAHKGLVVVIEDHQEYLSALKRLLELEGYACEAHLSAESFLQLHPPEELAPLGPCCLLCDVKLPAMSGLQLQERFADLKEMPLILMSGNSGVHEVAEGFRAGALDFLLKPIDAEVLLQRVSQALELSAQRQQERQFREGLRERIEGMSARERQIARRVAEGMLNREIAAEMHIALRTVKLHRHRALLKLGAKNVPELVRLIQIEAL
ncbi:MAG: response regulator transcription factor [Gammaproteobacteria bacterium]|nr:response regulator transcription factor [Gammaproteobacteria bacterium]